jgi:response regulator RpfG family c-di-GMP phosphodiesterase
MLKMIKEQLKEEFDVATAINGKLAINYLANRTADLILLDYEMPDESGADVIKKIRSNPETENIPVLFLTGVTDKNKIREIVQYKPQGYIIKPVSKNKLIATVKQTLENKE